MECILSKPRDGPDGTVAVGDEGGDKLSVKIGDKKGEKGRAHICVVLKSINSNQSSRVNNKLAWKGDAGTIDIVSIDVNFDAVDEIEVIRNDHNHSQWFIEWIQVNIKTKAYIFPIDRWMSPTWKMSFQLYDCVLPQFDRFSEQRNRELQKMKRDYAFGPQEPGLPCQVNSLPEGQSFSNDYQWKLLRHGAKDMVDGMIEKLFKKNWKGLQDIGDVYDGVYTVPEGMHNWRTDAEFGNQRLTGVNPAVIRLCTKIPENFHVNDEMIKESLEGLSIEEAIEKKRLFIVDYQILNGMKCTNPEKKICSPIALFYVNNLQLLPVAIQLSQEKSEENPVFLPTDNEYTWLLAKMWFNNADASYHQSAAHLGFTHLLVESIAAATHSCLSPSHPIFRLMAPHFLYLFAINSMALHDLVNRGGWVDQTMTIGRDGMFEIIRRRFANWRMDIDGILPNDLESRGLSDPNVLPRYWFRDDGMLLWKAIFDYVSTIVHSHYDTTETISEDFEIQNWNKTMSLPVTQGGCGIKGVPGNGGFKTQEEISQTVTSVIFTSSVMHAAVNFGQYNNYGFPAHYPANLGGAPPTDKQMRTEEEVFLALPDKNSTISIMEVTRLLSMKGTNGLGNFEVKYQFDPVGQKAVQKFIKDLQVVGSTINRHNNERLTPYTYLLPHNVPNAISI